MLVIVLFLGSRLSEGVKMLERSRQGSERSYLVIHYHPSLISIKYNLAKVSSPITTPYPTYDNVLTRTPNAS